MAALRDLSSPSLGAIDVASSPSPGRGLALDEVGKIDASLTRRDMASGELTAATHTSTGNWQTVALAAEDYDTNNLHSISSNSQRLTFTRAGYYLLIAQVGFAANVTGQRGVQINKNSDTASTNTLIETLLSATSAGGVVVPASGLFLFALGDFVSLLAYQNSGGNLAYLAPSFFQAVQLA